MSKKSQPDLLEVFTSEGIDKDRVYYLSKQGKIRKIAPMLYTTDMVDDIDGIVRRNLWRVVGLLYPRAVVSERTGVEMKIAGDGSLFVISDKKRPTSIGGITIRPKKGGAPQSTDMPFMENLFMASPARLVLENVVQSRVVNGVSRGLTRTELEEYLDKIIKEKGEDAINKIRNAARELAPKLGLQKEFEILNKVISMLLQTHEGKMESKVGLARSQGFPFDSYRVELFAKLYAELERTAPTFRHGSTSKTLAFFEAYFSNFIEGTKFAIDEAQDIIFKDIVPHNRPEDARDIKGTFDIVSNDREMNRKPKTFDDFMEILQSRHKILMGGRPDKKPGIIKEHANQAGSTLFVAPELVIGTFKQGFEIYKKLTTPFSKAVFMMFLIAEVHPFNDGNGRIGRIMMNAELVSSGEQRIIIPTIYRNNYISALKGISQNAITEPIIRTLDFAQKYTGAIDWNSFDYALDSLSKTRAFVDQNEADEGGVRLILPSKIID
ncbi:Fic family protein [Alphaproteobacteria bacterium]|nr:Fic family protein [Alphaproteobacteria bacterium]